MNIIIIATTTTLSKLRYYILIFIFTLEIRLRSIFHASFTTKSEITTNFIAMLPPVSCHMIRELFHGMMNSLLARLL